ncbi:MAG: PQQ-dependent sugar dehydrogenase [Bacteroidia bacterium]
MKRILLGLLLCVFYQGYSQLSLAPFASGITNLVDIASCGDQRIFLVQRSGVILIADSNGTMHSTPFLDIQSRVHATGLEPGLLSMTFAPDFKQSGVFYVYYTQINTYHNIITRFRVSADPDVADTSSEQIIIDVSTTTTHLGGDMAFGKDGYLYIGLGDGGGEGDPSNHAQDSTLLLGKFLRLDVSDVAHAGYTVPATNPFLGSAFRDEIWSVGFRNPWRWSFDRLTHDMWIGDVGQGVREEVDFEPSWNRGGKNYGWRCYEGTQTYNTSNCASASDYQQPVFEYPHGGACSVTGGFRYRGSSYSSIFGKYFFSDWCNTSIRTLVKNGSVVTDSSYGSMGISSGPVCFGEDQWGDLLVGTYNGTVYRLVDLSAHHVAWIWDEDSMHVCLQSNTVLQTPAGPGFHYQWYMDGVAVGNDTNILQVNTAANYSVDVQNAFGITESSTTVAVDFVTVPTVSIAGLDTVYCVAHAPVTVLPSPLGGVFKIDGVVQAIPQFDPAALGIGNHFVEYTYTTNYGCTNSTLMNVRVTACLNTGSIDPENKLVFPVPARDRLIIADAGEITCFDLSGRILTLPCIAESDKTTLDTRELSPGIYFCRIKKHGTTYIVKWIKE